MHIDALWKRQCPQVSMDLTCSKIILHCTCLHCLLSIVLFELSSYLRWQRYRLAKCRAGCHSRWRTALCQIAMSKTTHAQQESEPRLSDQNRNASSLQFPASYGILSIAGIPDVLARTYSSIVLLEIPT